MWLFLGIALGVGLLLLVLWLRGRGVYLRWYEWLLGIIGLALLLFALQNYQASTSEYEPTAPGMFLLVFGIPALLLVLVAAALVFARQVKAQKPKTSNVSLSKG